MFILNLSDDLYQYLQLVIKRYAGAGIDPEEGVALYHLNDFVKKAQHVDDRLIEAQMAQITKGAVAGDGPDQTIPATAEGNSSGLAEK